jgi:hypothetical protein
MATPKELLLITLADLDTARTSLLAEHEGLIQAASDATATAGNEYQQQEDDAGAEFVSEQAEYDQYLTDLESKADEAKAKFDSINDPTDASAAILAISDVTAPTLADVTLADVQQALDDLAASINTQQAENNIALSIINDGLNNGFVGAAREGGQKAAESLQLIRSFTPVAVDVEAAFQVAANTIETALDN